MNPEKGTAPALPELPTKEALAHEFIAQLRAALTPSDFSDMLARNRSPEYLNCCASGDFCDSNMVMLEAFKKLWGDPLDTEGQSMAIMDDACIDRWNAAWATARHIMKGMHQ